MQPLRFLNNWLQQHANSERYLFTLHDLRTLYPKMTNTAFKTLLSRTVRAGVLERVCRGLYIYKGTIPPNGWLLFHAAAYLRSNEFNYISLETVLSDTGIISQIPINYITVMTSGRSNKISCGRFGTIEFVHTRRKPAEIMKHLSYDTNCRLWRANVTLALKDMQITRRNCDLINWEMVNEFI